jgi:GTP-sensing pleiotropic transcriptional regulator CodY
VLFRRFVLFAERFAAILAFEQQQLLSANLTALVPILPRHKRHIKLIVQRYKRILVDQQ